MKKHQSLFERSKHQDSHYAGRNSAPLVVPRTSCYNEVPGMYIPTGLYSRSKCVGGLEAATREGISLTVDFLRKAKSNDSGRLSYAAF